MTSRKITVNNTEYEIKIVQLLDNSFEAGIFRADKLKAKMTFSAIDVFDIGNHYGQEPVELICRLLEDYAKSGFILGRA
jgi:hypothetical protein